MLEAGNRGDKQSRYSGVRVTWERTGMELGGSYARAREHSVRSVLGGGWCANQSRFCSSCCLAICHPHVPRTGSLKQPSSPPSPAISGTPSSLQVLGYLAEHGLQSVVVNSRLLASYVRPGRAQQLPVAFHELTLAELYIRLISMTLRRRFSGSKSSQRTCSWVDVALHWSKSANLWQANEDD
jgi:hypothetical protein